MEAEPVVIRSMHVSEFEPPCTEPQVTFYGTNEQLEILCSHLLAGSRFTVAAEGGPSGVVDVTHDANWTVPEGITRYSDTVEAHFRWLDDQVFHLELHATTDAFEELVDSIETSVLSPNSGHLHREVYLKGGELCTTWVSLIFDRSP